MNSRCEGVNTYSSKTLYMEYMETAERYPYLIKPALDLDGCVLRTQKVQLNQVRWPLVCRIVEHLSVVPAFLDQTRHTV